MNSVSLIGRLTDDPVIKNQDDERRAVCRYRLAVGRPGKDGKVEADFINIVSFGRAALTAAKFFRKGYKVGVTGQIRTGSYQNREGRTVYTTDIVAGFQEIVEWPKDYVAKKQAEKKAAPAASPEPLPEDPDFMRIPEDMDEFLPF